MLNGITDSERRWTDRVAPYVLFAILVLALFVRTYHLDSLPAGLYPDEATNGADTLLANETGDYRLLYTNNYGREGLFINLQALTIKYFGNTIPVLKFSVSCSERWPYSGFISGSWNSFLPDASTP